LATNDAQPGYQVVSVGTGRTPKLIFGLPVSYENESTWRQRQAAEMEEVCGEMLRQGLHLTHVVPFQKSGEFRGGWTEGAWLYFDAKT
jgi:hypothetical protein